MVLVYMGFIGLELSRGVVGLYRVGYYWIGAAWYDLVWNGLDRLGLEWIEPVWFGLNFQKPAKVRASHLLVKHKDSRRPSSWREENITRTKEDALTILQVGEMLRRQSLY